MTPAEIAKALRCTATAQTGEEPCASCPFDRTETLPEAQKAQLHCEEWHSCDVDGIALAAADLIERLEKEKSALLEYAKKSAGCEQCANYQPRCETVDGPCIECKRGSKWEWKGLVENK